MFYKKVCSNDCNHLLLFFIPGRSVGYPMQPLCSNPITGFFTLLRIAPHRYSDSCGASTWIHPLSSEQQVPTLHKNVGVPSSHDWGEINPMTTIIYFSKAQYRACILDHVRLRTSVTGFTLELFY